MGERGNTPFGGQVLQYETFEKCHFEGREPASDVISKERKRREILVMTVC